MTTIQDFLVAQLGKAATISLPKGRDSIADQLSYFLAAQEDLETPCHIGKKGDGRPLLGLRAPFIGAKSF